jgi:hypothetical protein
MKARYNRLAYLGDTDWSLRSPMVLTSQLSEFYSGDIKDTKLKEGQAPPPNISRTQVRKAHRLNAEPVNCKTL